jgi:Domain of unknown function (DUF1993)
MATSLYDLSVPTFLQTVKAVGGFLDRAAKHCAETRADPNDFVHARLFDDMAPFHFQIEAAWHHSVWGLEAVKTGEFAPAKYPQFPLSAISLAPPRPYAVGHRHRKSSDPDLKFLAPESASGCPARSRTTRGRLPDRYRLPQGS